MEDIQQVTRDWYLALHDDDRENIDAICKQFDVTLEGQQERLNHAKKLKNALEWEIRHIRNRQVYEREVKIKYIKKYGVKL